MNFFSIPFVVFFALTFIIYNAVPQRIKQHILLVASMVFYAMFDLKYTLILLLVIVVSFFASWQIDNKNQKYPKAVLAIGIAVIAAILIVFKFWNYAYLAIGRLFGISELASAGAAFIIAPIGISFFTLEAIGYIVDVYHGKVRAEKDFFKYALFISFFPKIMSGPIERSTNLLQQIRDGVKFDYLHIRKSFWLILWGSFVKLLIANRLAVIVNAAFNDYNNQTGFTMLIAVVLYGIQLYADFSGYSLIAIGLAGTFGYKLADNFIQPYFAINVKDFWKRWHISLSSWLRDYIYIPLGGNRKGSLRKYFNLFVTFTVSGLWHGTGIHFLAWGMIHGAFQVISSILDKTHLGVDSYSSAGSHMRFSSRFVRAIITFALVDFAWLFFRADSLGSAFEILRKIILVPEIGRSIFEGLCIAGVELRKGGVLFAEVVLLFVVDILHEKKINVLDWLDLQAKWFRWTIYVSMSLFIIIGMIRDYGESASTFIYANF